MVAVALLAAACGSDTTDAQGTADTAAPVSTAPSRGDRPSGSGPGRPASTTTAAPATSVATTAPDVGDGVEGTDVATGAPAFAFVLHADPAVDAELRSRFARLADFMASLTERNAGRPAAEQHHVTIMFSGNWGVLLDRDPDASRLVGEWIAAGHEMAFHSHTHNHQFLDGYTNATDLGPDDVERCMAGDTSAECTLDIAYTRVRDAVSTAAGRDYDIRWAGIGPTGNGGPDPISDNDNRCAPDLGPDGEPLADDDHCIRREYIGEVAAGVEFIASDHPGVTVDDTDDPHALLGTSLCMPWAPDGSDVYYLPYSPYETESGRLRVTLDVIDEAVAVGSPGEMIGIVVHPHSYADSSSRTYAGSRRDRIEELFDHLDATLDTDRPVVSRTLSEIHDADTTEARTLCG
ncbi:MAG: hypothetical protein D6683_02830 [Actinomyces sp.]|nr:MAG: hypothetical protein D6683_02830 [Actinomyces sp.]